MTRKSNHSTELMCFINIVALGKDGKNIQHKIEHWINCSGIEWTCSRLKAMKDIALHLKEKRADLAIEICQANSISHRSGFPKGPFNKVIRNFVSATKPQELKKCMAVLRTYTSLKLKNLSSRQSCKIEKSITTVSSCEEFIPEIVKSHNIWEDYQTLRHQYLTSKKGLDMKSFHCALLRNGYDLNDNDVRIVKALVDTVHSNIDCRPVFKKGNLRERGLFSLEKLRPYTSCYSPISMRVPKDSEIPYCKAVHSLLSTSYMPQSLDQVIPLKDTRDSLKDLMGEDKYVGKVHVIQSSGCKGRAVAIPNAWIQMAFLPLHYALDEAQKSISNTMVYDQNKGANLALSIMNDGKSVYSSDLSSATDRFPLFLQTELLRHNGLDRYADALEDICAGSWRFVDHEGVEKSISYNCGQPMGLYGSFPLFNITHSFMCKCLESALSQPCLNDEEKLRMKKHLNEGIDEYKDSFVLEVKFQDPVFPSENPFREDIGSSLILGDDVVFSDGRLKELYDRTLSLMGVEVAPEKCYSGDVTEFAGFLIMKADQTAIAFRPLKIDDGRVHDKLEQLSLFDSLGSNLRRMKPRWARKFEIFGKTRAFRNLDLSPAIPEEDDPLYQPMQLNSDYFLRVVNLLAIHSDKYVDYDKIVKTEPIIYDGFRDYAVASPLRYTEPVIETNILRREETYEYKSSQFRTDPLIQRVVEDRLWSLKKDDPMIESENEGVVDSDKLESSIDCSPEYLSQLVQNDPMYIEPILNEFPNLEFDEHNFRFVERVQTPTTTAVSLKTNESFDNTTIKDVRAKCIDLSPNKDSSLDTECSEDYEIPM